MAAADTGAFMMSIATATAAVVDQVTVRVPKSYFECMYEETMVSIEKLHGTEKAIRDATSACASIWDSFAARTRARYPDYQVDKTLKSLSRKARAKVREKYPIERIERRRRDRDFDRAVTQYAECKLDHGKAALARGASPQSAVAEAEKECVESSDKLKALLPQRFDDMHSSDHAPDKDHWVRAVFAKIRAGTSRAFVPPRTPKAAAQRCAGRAIPLAASKGFVTSDAVDFVLDACDSEFERWAHARAAARSDDDDEAAARLFWGSLRDRIESVYEEF